MSEKIKYTCSCCGKEHDDWPALSYSSPTNYHQLSETEKERLGELNSDFCVITYPDQTDRFIRCTMMQQVADYCNDLQYGIWVSYFGWLSNDLPDYDFSKGSIPVTVFTQPGNSRPIIVPHHEFDHPFVRDYYNGISREEAERRINAMLKSIEEKEEFPTRYKTNFYGH